MFDFTELYQVGEELSQNPDEIHIRSAINREYYALFGGTRQYLVEKKRQKTFAK